MAKIVLYCQPGAKKTKLAGIHDGKIKIQLKAQPIDGKANKELVAFLAKLCNVPKAAINIDIGKDSRTKLVEVLGLTDDELKIALSLR